MDNGLFKIKKSGKHKYIFLSLFLLMIFLLIPCFDSDEKLAFSLESGYYEEPIYLEIQGADRYSIYYTLDGTEPTQNSIPYDGEFYLEDASLHSNVYSERTDTSAGFYQELVEEYSAEFPGYIVPAGPVDKCNIVRAAAFDRSGNCVDSITGFYFIGFDQKILYQNMWMVSLITDPKNLFDYETGIYVTGKVFDEYAQLLPDENTPNRGTWWWWDANYRIRGKESERPAHVEIFNPERQRVLSDDCGIRIQGRGSRGKNPKSLSVYARREYSGSEEFSEDIFGIGGNSHKFVIFSGADDSAYKIKDYLAHTLEAELNFSTMQFRPAMLFLDGEYWGMYYITESYNADFISDHYDVPQEEVIFVKEEVLEEGMEKEIELFQEMRTFISENDMSVEENYEKAKSLIDMDSYIDYYAAQIFIGRYGDWPVKNEAAWRTRNVLSDNEYGDGRWRWMLFDVNSGSLATSQLEVDTLSNVMWGDSVFGSLFKSPAFRERFVERMVYIAEEVYADEKVDQFVDAYLEEMIEPICSNNVRFIAIELRDEGIANIEDTRTFLKQRRDFIYQMMGQYVGAEYVQAAVERMKYASTPFGK